MAKFNEAKVQAVLSHQKKINAVEAQIRKITPARVENAETIAAGINDKPLSPALTVKRSEILADIALGNDRRLSGGRRQRTGPGEEGRRRTLQDLRPGDG